MKTKTPERLELKTALPQTPAEFGFVHQEAGPLYTPVESDLPRAYQGLIDRPLHTQLLVTDQQNPVITTTLIGFNKKATTIADNIEPNKSDSSGFSDDVQGYFLKNVKKFVDEGPSSVKVVKHIDSNPVFYGGSVGVSNGRLLRVYMAPIGSYEGIPVIAKIGACRTKEQESKLYRALFNKTGKL